MSRYGNHPKDDLYSELLYRYEQSKMSLTDFIVMLMEVITDIIRDEGSRL